METKTNCGWVYTVVGMSFDGGRNACQKTNATRDEEEIKIEFSISPTCTS
jgi:hypothetical protein